MRNINLGQAKLKFMQVVMWPFCLLSSMSILALGFSKDAATLNFIMSYLWIIACLLLCERWFTYRVDWARTDGQTGANIYHTLLNKGLVQVAIVVGISTGTITTQEEAFLSDWPLALQVLLGLITSELGLYSAQRSSHDYPYLSRFQSGHHSV